VKLAAQAGIVAAALVCVVGMVWMVNGPPPTMR
jgi:hypothetical protein